jgi:flagellin
MARGDLIINGIQVGATKATDDLLSVVNKESSAIAKVAAINAVSSQTGVVASIGNTQAYGSSMQVANTTGSLTINGVNTSTITDCK